MLSHLRDGFSRDIGVIVNTFPPVPQELLPQDGRFGAGPSKVRPEQVEAISRAGVQLLGTSHRQAPVKNLVKEIQEGLREFFGLPEGYEIVLGNGGATSFWDAATFGLVRHRAEHLSFGEFGSKFAQATAKAPFLEESLVISAEPGSRPTLDVQPGIDVYAWPQNETSTGVSAPVLRPAGIDDDALVIIDATSAAGGLAVDISQTDVYYFSPQKNFASDGGLWLAVFSPAAIARVEEIIQSGRWIPDSLNLHTAIENSRKNQTYNTPALSTLVMLAEQVRWLNQQGGIAFAAQRTAESASRVYSWAEKSAYAAPFVKNPKHRSNVICTVDFDESIDATRISQTLRQAGVVDIEPYRKLGKNQLRIATFTAIEPDDVSALLRCIDYVVEDLAAK